MGVGAGLSMYVVVVQKFTFAISSPDEFLFYLFRLTRYKEKCVKTRCYQEGVGHFEPRVPTKWHIDPSKTVSYVITCCLPFCRVFADVTRRRYWAAVRGKVDITFICPPCKDDVLAQVAAENRSMAVDVMDDDHDAAEGTNVSVADNDDVDDEDEQHHQEAIMDVSNDDHSGTSYLWSPYVILVKQQYLLYMSAQY